MRRRVWLEVGEGKLNVGREWLSGSILAGIEDQLHWYQGY